MRHRSGILVLMTAIMLSGCAALERGKAERERLAREAHVLLPANAAWLDSLGVGGVEQEWGEPRAGLSIDSRPLTLGGRIYRHGIGTHARSEMTIDLHGEARWFDTFVGVDDECGRRGSVEFVIKVDGVEKARSRVLHGGDAPQKLTVDLTDAARLTLNVENAGDGIDYDHADWAAAMIKFGPRVAQQPSMWVSPPGPDPRIAPANDAELAIHAPFITGATPGRPLLFRIPATGTRPMHFAADALPDGLTLDADLGIITGSLHGEGRWDVHVTVDNAQGRAVSTLTIVGGAHVLARTPPMGWNSWNVWGTSVDDAKVRAAADGLVKSGLADLGFQYVNIDDAWEGTRDAQGRIRSNEKFPDMKALADYVHARGLKLGIYSSPGRKTCAGYEGSLGHEKLDAETYAAWGIDLLKYDWCSYGEIAPKPGPEELSAPYRLMRESLDAVGRDIVFSLCQYGMGDVWQWGGEVGGNYWRTTGDITDSWTSMSGIGFGQDGHEAFAGPGHWNDPDMLVVGRLGWGPALHETRLTRNEQVTHITLWSLLAAPLLIGCDLSHVDDFTRAVLGNPEVIAVDQDPLGKPARRVHQSGDTEAWARPLADGSMAVGLFNRGRGEATVRIDWPTLGVTGPQRVRDLWSRQEQGEFAASYSAVIAGHGAVLLKVTHASEKAGS